MKVSLSNCWCKASEQNYKALISKGIKPNLGMSLKSIEFMEFIITYANSSMWMVAPGQGIPKNRKKIQLVDGDFEYVYDSESSDIETQTLNYKDVEFVITKPPKCFGSNYNKKRDFTFNWNNKDMDTTLNTKESVICGQDWLNGILNLQNYGFVVEVGIKPKWYEIESNFPCIVIKLDGLTHETWERASHCNNINELCVNNSYESASDYRMATKLEMDSMNN